MKKEEKTMKNPKVSGNGSFYEDDRPVETDDELFCSLDEDDNAAGIFSKIKEKQRSNEKNKENYDFFG